MTENIITDRLSDESDSESLTIKPRRARVLTDSDDENDCCLPSEPLQDITNNEPDSPKTVDKGVHKFGFKSSLITDSDVEYDNDSDVSEKYNTAAGENAASVQAEDNQKQNPCSDEDKNEELSAKPKKKAKKLKKTLDDKLAIRSETQRLEREKPVHLPYHRPKQRSLREFLSRKKNHLNEDSLRLTSPNMIHTWKEIDKSIKETAEFFKSESEEEAEPEMEPEVEEPTSAPQENTAECSEVAEDPVTEIESEVLAHNSDKLVLACSPTPQDKSDDGVEPMMDELDALDTINDVPVISRKDKAAQWLDAIATYERNTTMKNKLQLSPTILNKVPTLSNDCDDFIDLEESPKTDKNPGVEQFIEKVLKKFEKKSSEAPQTLTTTFIEKDEFGGIKNIGVETTVLNGNAIDKPGLSRQLYKENLRMKIESKWEKEFNERNTMESSKDGFENDAELDENLDEPELEEDESSTESETEPEEEDEAEVVEKPRKFCEFGDSEAEESNDDACDGDDETEEDEEVDQNSAVDPVGKDEKKDDEELDCSLLPAFQPGGGFSMGGSSLTQQSQPLPIKPSSPLSSPANLSPKSIRDDKTTPLRTEKIPDDSVTVESTVKKNLFGTEIVPSVLSDLRDDVNDETDDPFLFVSGAFPATVEGKKEQTSQYQLKRIITPDESEDSRGVESNHEVVADNDDEQSISKESAILDDDDVEITVKKKNKQLVFSDDEEDETPKENVQETVDDIASETSDTEAPDVAIDDVNYDSEENEVRPGEFFDKEAELSESEWSGDEDEQGLDALEAEAGDADVFDENQVASQLGRIHMRQVLDEDARNVRRLQELFFEDGDLYTEGGPRERNYRWKNIDGFDWNSVYKSEDVADGEVLELSDRAKLRFEKNQFLLKAQQEGKLQEIEESVQDKNSVLVLGRQMLQRLQPQTGNATGLTKTQKLLPRGSFLTKDKSFLTRIARVTAGGNDAPLLGASHSKNFTFAVQERIEEVSSTYSEGCKRKAETCTNTVKKARIVMPESFFDQLRPTEASTH